MKHSPTYTPIREDYQKYILDFLKNRDVPNLRKNLVSIVYRLKRIAIPNAEEDLPDADAVMRYSDEELRIFNGNVLSRYFNLC